MVKEGGRIIQKNKGVLYILRPGKFRWSASIPTKQLIISNGKTLWIFDQDLEQVTVKKLNDEVQGTPALFLSGADQALTEQYQVSMKKRKGIDTFLLKPKNKTSNQYQWIAFEYRQDLLQKITFKDKLGQTTSLELSKVQNNPKLPKNLFELKIPKGVDVITQ